MGEVIEARIVSTLPVPVEKVIDKTPRDLAEVVVAGLTEDGTLYFASSQSYGPDVLWVLEKAKYELLKISSDMENGDGPQVGERA